MRIVIKRLRNILLFFKTFDTKKNRHLQKQTLNLISIPVYALFKSKKRGFVSYFTFHLS